MNVFNKVGAKLKKKSHLVTDAIPCTPQEDNNSNNGPPSPSPSPAVDIEDVSDNISNEYIPESPPIVTEPSQDSPPVPPRRRKPKRNAAPNANKKEEKKDFKPPPINTHASGNVINIVNANGIHVGPEVTYNIYNSNKNKDDQDNDSDSNHDAAVKKTKSIVAVMDSDEKISHEHMDIVSRNLGNGWRNVFRKLGYTSEMIDTIHETHQHKGVAEVIYQLLLDWVRTGKRTLGELCTELWKRGKRTAVKEITNIEKVHQKQQDLD